MKHDFKPTHYYTTLGPHESVLRIADGDTVSTTTADAHGCDAHGDCVAKRPNPQTGPFYIEGAEPGDTLEVRFDRIYPNRDYGWTSTVVAPNVVVPDYVSELPVRGERVPWQVDLEKGTAALKMPETKLGELTLPLAPMLGCFGVSPKNGQAISADTSAEHGGNMDYRGFGPGVTVYLPIFEQGGLFTLGDGHAVQGDGEIVGTGIEITMDVEFTVRVHKGKCINWPRGEDRESIFTVGNARPLDYALQIATAEMLRWLQEDHGLDALGANVMLGQCVEYDVGNVYDPAYTMVCKVPKRVLDSVGL